VWPGTADAVHGELDASVTHYPKPLFDTEVFDVCGRTDGDLASLWARDPEGQLAMEACATLAPLV